MCDNYFSRLFSIHDQNEKKNFFFPLPFFRKRDDVNLEKNNNNIPLLILLDYMKSNSLKVYTPEVQIEREREYIITLHKV